MYRCGEKRGGQSGKTCFQGDELEGVKRVIDKLEVRVNAE